MVTVGCGVTWEGGLDLAVSSDQAVQEQPSAMWGVVTIPGMDGATLLLDKARQTIMSAADPLECTSTVDHP